MPSETRLLVLFGLKSILILLIFRINWLVLVRERQMGPTLAIRFQLSFAVFRIFTTILLRH